jgi:hypothetical protein
VQLYTAFLGLLARASTWTAKQVFSLGLSSSVAPTASTDVARKYEVDAEATTRASAVSSEASTRASADTAIKAKWGWVVVAPAGTSALRSGGGLSVTVAYVSTGLYTLTATNIQNGCVVATPRMPSVGQSDRTAHVVEYTTNKVYVEVYDADGTYRDDTGFTAHVFVP